MSEENWNLKSVIDEEHLLLEREGFLVKATRYAQPWRPDRMEDLARLAVSVKPHSCVVVGAHIGEPILWLAKAGCRSMLAYEHDPAYCRLLYENLELNKISAEVRCEAVGGGEDRRYMRAVGGPVRTEVVGLYRILRGDVDLVALCCPECAKHAGRLNCSALTLPRAVVVPAELGEAAEKLRECGFSLTRSHWYVLAARR